MNLKYKSIPTEIQCLKALNILIGMFLFLYMICFIIIFNSSEEIYKNILKLLQKEDILAIHSAAWCVAWSGYEKRNLIPPDIAAKLCIELADLWVNRDMSYGVRRIVSWGIVSVCIPSFQMDILQGITGLEEMIEKCYRNPENEYDAWAAIYLGILLKLWSKEETERKIKERKSKLAIIQKKFLKQKGFCYSDRKRDMDFENLVD